jgi:hypothetical protein
LTAALAYNAMAYTSPFLDEQGSAAEDIAVAWAVLRYTHTQPASIEDRFAFKEAEAEMLRAAQTLGFDETGLRTLLQERVERNGPRLAQPQCLDDTPA